MIRANEGHVFDTPGFSLLELPLTDPLRLKEGYPEFAPYEGACRFAECAHLREPGCALRAAVDAGEVDEVSNFVRRNENEVEGTL